MTTLGHLIESLYAKYERELHDTDLAAEATQKAIEEILEAQGLAIQVAE
jgi:hypothetical protein